ncbi:hypothetical protein DICPUDRAFT_152989 [Dictyostelium purpureum]|uniref:Uncharacterized protein n=1 Tax=Dictyostelium purpureum TaxID=5786 RepID=F0ZMS7_DICPU|nr:uncharacterized protein DICPUDRAFT_152989 [Dictyostelium purpureum]EGC34754.1 hypothetical protein DICPUDRAFT_152989 [Dictyostelium purpureum]|eukprot:XP_003288716.1 hypothetical protein DICPUDRAFT_152989 [Dictyostelium purpureum]
MKTYFHTNRITINNKSINKKYRVTINLENELNNEAAEFIKKFQHSPNLDGLYYGTIKINDNNNHFEDEIACFFIISKANQNKSLIELLKVNNNTIDGLEKSLFLKDIYIDPLYSGNLFYFISILKSLKISHQCKYKSFYISTKSGLTSTWINLEKVGFKRVYDKNPNKNQPTNTLNHWASKEKSFLYKYDMNEANKDWDELINNALSTEFEIFWKQFSSQYNIKSKL